ncbi:MAG TPA: F0F1 ATP synthase subunit delta [Woeseiaceae bacterium]|nr:F0F1 ATP synthase subunit delta [Woeseiaceae bacterium]
MADNNTIARPYAQAAFDVANEAGELTSWSQSLALAGALLANGEVADFLSNPGLDGSQRLDFLTELFAKAGASKLAGGDKQGTNFLKLLLEYGRVAVMPEISEHFEAFKAKVENTVDVTVTSAAALTDADRKEFAQALEKRLGRKVELKTEIDESLIGGAVIRAGDVVIDGSLRARLAGLTNALVN